jgi:DNA-binding LacI/PurR family transcriptional regulator
MTDTSMVNGRRSDVLTPAEIRRIAAEAGVEPRTAAKYIRGERVVSTCGDRIRRALEALDFSQRAGTR